MKLVISPKYYHIKNILPHILTKNKRFYKYFLLIFKHFISDFLQLFYDNWSENIHLENFFAFILSDIVPVILNTRSRQTLVSTMLAPVGVL